MDVSKLRSELEEVNRGLQGQLDAWKEDAEAMSCSVYEMKDSFGRRFATDVLVAKAQVLKALADLGPEEIHEPWCKHPHNVSEINCFKACADTDHLGPIENYHTVYDGDYNRKNHAGWCRLIHNSNVSCETALTHYRKSF